jgi:hypothetical protein
MTRSFCAIVVAAVVWGAAAVVGAPPVAAAGALTVTPHAGLLEGKVVTISGTGFPANTDIGYCEGIADATPSIDDCIATASLVTSSSQGTFSVEYTVQRWGTSSSHGAVDCAAVQCSIGAAVFSDIANTAVYRALSFNPYQIDGRLKEQANGRILGDGTYSGEGYWHRIRPGGKLVWAVQAQNDGLSTDDVVLKAAAGDPGNSKVEIRYFVGYYDVTASITGPGITIRNLAPGAVRTFAVRMTAASDADIGSVVWTTISFASGHGGGGQTVVLYAQVVSP